MILARLIISNVNTVALLLEMFIHTGIDVRWQKNLALSPHMHLLEIHPMPLAVF